MEEFFASGRAVDVVFAVLLAEFLFLWWRGRHPLDLILMLLPAALFLVALRAALVGAPWPWIAGALALSFPAHLADLARRKNSAGP